MFSKGKSKGSRQEGAKQSASEDDWTEPKFVCERVCTSEALMSKVKAASKDYTPNTCVTVCGVSPIDACTEACQRSVCVNPSTVPAWNEQCLRQCTNECLKFRTM